MLFASNRVRLKDARNSLRVKESKRVVWTTRGSDFNGRGWVRDISTTGMKIETNEILNQEDGSILSFDASLDKSDYIPQTGRLVWQQRKGFSKNRYLYGIEFIEPSEDVLSRLRSRVQRGIKRVTTIRRVFSFLDIFLFSVFVALFIYVLYLSSQIIKIFLHPIKACSMLRVNKPL